MKRNRHIFRLLLFLILIIIAFPCLYGQKYIVDWAKTFTGTGWNRVTAITSDTDNNIILAGAFDKSCDIGLSHYNSKNFNDQVLVKYDSAGTVLWTKHFSSNLYTETPALLSCENGDIILAGTFRDSLFLDGSLIQNSKVSAIFIASLDPAGNLKWSKVLATAPGIHANSICKDGAGNLYLSGSFREQTVFVTGQLTAKGQSDIFLAKVTPTGNLSWVKQIGGEGNDQPQKVLLYNQNIFLTGNYNRDIEVPVPLTSSEYGNGFIMRFNETGQIISTKTLAGNNNNLITGMTIDREGNIYTAGNFKKQLEPKQGTFFNTSTVAGFVTKFGNNLDYKWTKIISEGEAYHLSGIITDNNNRFFITGTFRDQLICNTETLENNTGNTYIFLLEYNPDGEEQWVKSFKESTDYSPKTIMADKRNRIYLAGAFAGNGRFDSEGFIAKGRKDGFLVNLLDPCTLLKYDLQDEYVLCTGETEVLDPGTGFASYNWNNGLSDKQLLSVSQPGTYSVEVTNARGCTETNSVEITIDSIYLVLPKQVILCSNQQVILDAGEGYLEYNWNSGLHSDRYLTVFEGGKYSVSVTTINGCNGNDTTQVVANTLYLTYQTTNEIFPEGNNGAIEITVTGNFVPFTYLWNTGETIQDISNLEAGVYIIQVTDSAGCILEEEIIIESETASGILDIFNQPNPFHYITRVIYSLPESAKIDISVYDMSGRKVMILVNRKAREGWHTFTFNRNNLVSGVYYLQIQTGKGLVSRKMIIIEQKY